RANRSAAMSKLSDLRTKYPQYSDMSDQEFADAFYTKFYSDMPREKYDADLGLTQPGILDSMAETGKKVREAVMHPGQSIPDLLRSSSDFVSFGLTDRLRSAFKGTD